MTDNMHGLFNFRTLGNPHGLRFIEGEAGAPAGEAPAGDNQAPAVTPDAPKPAPPANAPQAPAQTAQTAQTGADGWTLDEAVKEIGRLRGENAKDRTNAKAQAADEARQAFIQELGKALGLVTDDTEQVDPARITADLQAAQEKQRETAIELAIYKAATAAGADPAKLTDSRSFMASIPGDLDPTNTDAVTALIRDAVAANSTLKTTARVAGASSADHAGGSGESAITPEQFRAMSGSEKNTLFRTDPTTYARLSGNA